MKKPRILVFASGSADGGGSGFEKLVESSRGGPLDAEIIAVVSNHANGGVRKRADKLGVQFIHFPGPQTGEGYQKIVNESGADFFALSGWLKKVVGLNSETNFNSKTVFNIHPGPLPKFGGPGLYGHHVHEAVIAAFKRAEVTHSAVSMHFVTEEYDRGPVFLNYRIKINNDDTPESLAHRVNQFEHYYQPRITNLVVNGLISWDGLNPDSLICPKGHLISFSDFE
jgi:phosphoribosylglycinamide formyltransferase-1